MNQLPPLAPHVRRTVLDNGLTVLALEDRSAEVAAAVTWVRSGYLLEEDDQVGIAHVAEHLYFSGTERYPDPEAFSRAVKSLGGELNAATSYDFTAYHVMLPVAGLAPALARAADAFAGPLLDPVGMEKEIGAIRQEARRKLDNPAALAAERSHALAFDVHRVRRWRMGTDEQLLRYGPEDVRRWWRGHYVPSNTVVAVVAPLEVVESTDLVAAAFADLLRGSVSRSEPPREPGRPATLRYEHLPGDLRATRLAATLPVPGDLAPEAAALDVAGAILASGRSSRMAAELRDRQGVARTVGAGRLEAGDLGMFRFELDVEPPRSAEALTALWSLVGDLARTPPAESELQRHRARLEASTVLARAGALGQAQLLASAEARGGVALADADVAERLAVTGEEVSAAVARWLAPSSAAIVEHGPRREEDPPGITAEGLAAVLERAAGPWPPARSVALTPGPVVDRADERKGAAKRSASPAGPWSAREVLPGVRLAHRQDRSLPCVTVGVTALSGRLADTGHGAGTTRLMATLLARSTRRRSSLRLAEEFESLGAGLATHAGPDSWGLAASFLADRVVEGSALLFEALLEPAFSPEELKLERALLDQRRRAAEDDLMTHAVALARQAAFGHHPYGLPELGTEASIVALSHEGVQAAHEAAASGEIVVAVVGDIERSRAEALVQESLAGRRHGAGARAVMGPATFHEGRVVEVPRQKAQAAQALLAPGVPAGHADAIVLEVIAAFTSGLGGRFHEEVRTRRGLAYVVATMPSLLRRGGTLAAVLATSPERATEARDVLLGEFSRVALEPPGPEELARAKATLVGRHVLGLQGAAAQAGAALALLAAGRPLSDLDDRPAVVHAVTADDVARVAAERMDPARLTRSVVGLAAVADHQA